MTILNERRRLNTGPLDKNLYGKILKYPLDLESANGHYMIFNVFSRTNKDRDLPAVDLNVGNNQTQFYNNTFTRERFFGKGLDLTKAIRAGKDAGATIPKGMLKKAAEFDQQLLNQVHVCNLQKVLMNMQYNPKFLVNLVLYTIYQQMNLLCFVYQVFRQMN